MEFLYRFHPDKSYTLETLKRGEILFNSVENFKDKEEFTALFRIFTTVQTANTSHSNSENKDKFDKFCEEEYGSVENWSKYINNMLNNTFKDKIEEQLRCFWRVCCFTKSYKSEYMWDNYANKTGFCVEYKFDEVKQQSNFLGEINYTDDKPIISSTVDSIILTTKTTNWEKENEIRALIFLGINDHSIVDVSEYFKRDKEYAYCFLDVLEIQDEKKRTELISKGIKALYYKERKMVFKNVRPNAIIVYQFTSKYSSTEVPYQIKCS